MAGSAGFSTMSSCRGYCSSLSGSDYSTEWDAMSALANPELNDSRPQQGIEIRRIAGSAYFPLTALIVASTISIRRLHLQVEFMRLWLDLNWAKIYPTTTMFQKAFPPVADHAEMCLALTEFITETWTVVYDDGDTAHVDWLPIAIGITAELFCENLQLPARPTMRARFGTEDARVHSESSC